MLRAFAVFCCAASLFAYSHAASAQYGGPPIIVQTPQLPRPPITDPITLKPLNGPALKDLPAAPTPVLPPVAAPPAAAPAAAKP